MNKNQLEMAQLFRGVGNFILAVFTVLAFAGFDMLAFFVCLTAITAINFTMLKPRVLKLIGQSTEPVPDFNLLPAKYINRGE
ncbi:MAG: hypothetical protein GY765_32370 [bacterium]|nr:hypothetical protein [bacterium]